MREAVGTSWTFGLIVTFIFLFAAFLILAINYSDSFRLRNEVLTIIEKYEGFTSNAKEIVDNYLSNEGYSTTGGCPDDYSGVNFDSKTVDNNPSGSYNYCVRLDSVKDRVDLILFYRFNLPVIGNIMVFQIDGSTNSVKIDYDKSLI